MRIKTRIQEVTLSLNRQGRLKRKLSIAAAVVTLAVIGSLMNSRQSVVQGAGGPTVTIDSSQLPLPVKGSATVSGMVAATQSGPWNIGISGTPTINAQQSGTWNVGLTGTPGVNIANSPSFTLAAGATVSAHNLDDVGRIPYESSIDQKGVCGASSCAVTFPFVPPNHRLVMQHIAWSLNFTATPTSVTAFVSGNNIDFGGFSAADAVQVNSLHDQQVLYILDAGVGPLIQILGNGAGFAGAPNPQLVTITGYMLDCTAAPCAAIAR